MAEATVTPPTTSAAISASATTIGTRLRRPVVRDRRRGATIRGSSSTPSSAIPVSGAGPGAAPAGFGGATVGATRVGSGSAASVRRPGSTSGIGGGKSRAAIPRASAIVPASGNRRSGSGRPAISSTCPRRPNPGGTSSGREPRATTVDTAVSPTLGTWPVSDSMSTTASE